MAADGRKPEAERRNYKNIFDALRRIGKEEGIGALWRGSAPTVARACLLNMGLCSIVSELPLLRIIHSTYTTLD